MSHRSCCVVNCKNTSRKNKDLKFIYFPQSYKRVDQRNKWIQAVRRKNPNGTVWIPKKDDVICSQHFVDGYKSNDPKNPNYVPTIFPSIYKKKHVDSTAISKRYNRWINSRNISSKNVSINESISNVGTSHKILENDIVLQKDTILKNNDELNSENISHKDQECQVGISMGTSKSSFDNVFENIFVCNRYISMSCCDVEVQTEISLCPKFLIGLYINNEVNTPSKIYSNTSMQTEDDVMTCNHFKGYETFNDDKKLINFVGISRSSFNYLLQNAGKEILQSRVSSENKLLILLMKLKIGLNFSELGVFFGVHQTTITRIFEKVLINLFSATKKYIFWPDKINFLNTNPDYSNKNLKITEIIITSMHIKVGNPSGIDNKGQNCTDHKKNVPGKVLIGIKPDGFISFISPVNIEETLEPQIKALHELLDNLETNHKKNKNLPKFQQFIDESGKKSLLVIPPTLENNKCLSKPEIKHSYAKTHNYAKEHVNVEKIIQRFKIFNILNNIPEHLFKHVDKIIHICGILVNLQNKDPTMFNENNKDC